MAPISSDEESDDIPSSVSMADSDQPEGEANGTLDARFDEGEEEFHTEDSENSEDVEDDGGSDLEGDESASGVPLLPESLLKHIPQAAQSAPSLADVPWEKLSSKQKKARRNNSRKMKKRQYDRLRGEVKGTGVLEAGKAAQEKRGIPPAKKDKVRSARVEKKTREANSVSGRQKMLDNRKRAVERAASGAIGCPPKKPRTSGRAKSKG